MGQDARVEHEVDMEAAEVKESHWTVEWVGIVVCNSGNVERDMKEIEHDNHRTVWNGLMLGNSVVALAAAANIDEGVRSDIRSW